MKLFSSVTTLRDFYRIFAYLRPRLPLLLLSTVFMAIVALCTAAYAWLVGPVIKSLFLSEGGSAATGAVEGFLARASLLLADAPAPLIGGLLVGAAAVKGLAFYLERILVIRAGQDVVRDLRAALFSGMLRTNPLQLDARTAGELVSRFSVDAQIVEHAVTSGALSVISAALQVLVLAALALSLSWKLGLVGLVAFPPIALLIARLGRVLRHRQGEFYDSYGELAKTVEETREGLFTVQAFDARRFVEHRFDRVNRTLAEKAVAAARVGAIASPLNEVIGAGAPGITLWYAHQQIASAALTPEAFISFFTSLFLLYRPVRALGSAIHSVQTGLAALDRLEPIIARQQDPAVRRQGGGVVVSGVTAGYGDHPPVLSNLTFRAAKGERICVAGESGCGKTTLLHVLAGYLAPAAGTVECDRPAALVTQNPFLFDDTIEVNVRLGRWTATDEEVALACADAGVTAFTGADGLGMAVGPAGSSLSAGQRQRVCLARALLSDAPLVLLDEVTASLDGHTEQALIANLDRRLSGRTVILVTHRPEAARWAGRVLVLEEGRVRHDGRFDELLAAEQKVARLFGEDP